jgi:hypothetical protein
MADLMLNDLEIFQLCEGEDLSTFFMAKEKLHPDTVIMYLNLVQFIKNNFAQLHAL